MAVSLFSKCFSQRGWDFRHTHFRQSSYVNNTRKRPRHSALTQGFEKEPASTEFEQPLLGTWFFRPATSTATIGCCLEWSWRIGAYRKALTETTTTRLCGL